jgi:mannose-6-phosphate isomerase-like protein (cupin superfamily)
VVTGEDADGASHFALTDIVQGVLRPSGRTIYPVWGHDGVPTLPCDGQAAVGPTSFPPEEGGFRVQILRFPAHDCGVSPEAPAARAAFSGPRRRAHDPETGMHKTDTIDVGIVLEGAVVVELDDGERVLGPGDVIVQNGTTHAWRNRSGEPCTMAMVILAADRHETKPAPSRSGTAGGWQPGAQSTHEGRGR